MADYKIVVIKDGKPTNLAAGDAAEAPGLVSLGTITATGTLSAATGSTIGNLTLANGSITDSGGAISFGADNISTTGTLGAGVATLASSSTIGTLTLADGSITDSGGSIDFGDENLSTTGTLGAGVATLASSSTIGTLTLADGSITDSGGSIDFGNENLSTTGTLGAGVATLASSSTIGTLTLADGSITDSGGSIDFGNENLSTTGTLSAGTGSTIGNLTLANGSITDSGGSISFGDENLSTTGTLGAGVATLASSSTIGTLTLADGSITDSGGSIDFGNENLSTTGTLGAGVATLASNSTIGTLTLADGSITDSGGSIDFGNENLSTTGTLSAAATTLSSTLSVTGDATVGGNLNVAGDIVSRGATDVILQDQFLDINGANTATAPSAGGYTATVQSNSDVQFFIASFTAQSGATNPFATLSAETGTNPTFHTGLVVVGGGNFATGDTIIIQNAAGSNVTFEAGGSGSNVNFVIGGDLDASVQNLAAAIAGNANFRAAYDATNSPTRTILVQWAADTGGVARTITAGTNTGGWNLTGSVDSTSTPQIQAGQIIQISGAVDQVANNGIFVIESTGATQINVRDINDTLTLTPFAQNNFEAGSETNNAAQARFINLYVQAVSDGSLTNSSSVAIQTGVLCDSFNTFATYDSFVDGYAIVGASAVTTTLQNAYDNGSQINNTNTGTPFQVSGAGTVTLTSSDDLSFNSSKNGAVADVGLSTQSASVDLHATDNTNNPSFSLLANNDSAISILTDLGAEAQLTIGSYVDSNPSAGSIGSVKIAADRLYNTVRFGAGVAVSSGDAVAMVQVIDQASVTVDTIPANTDTFVLDSFGGTTYTITFTTTDQESSTTFDGSGNATISTALGRDDSLGSIAHAMAELYNSIADLNATNNADITVTNVPGATETLVLNGYAGQNYTITFQNGGGTNTTWSGAGPFTANIDITVDNTVNDVADAIATLYNEVDGGSGDVTAVAQGDKVEVQNSDLTNELNITDTTGGDLTLSFKSGLVADNVVVADSLVFTDSGGNFTVDPDSAQGVVVPADSTTANSRTSFVGIAFEAGAAGDTIDVVIGGTRTITILTADLQNLNAGSSLYLSATAGEVGTSPSASGQTIFQVGVAISGVNPDTGTAICLIQPMFIAEIA